MRTYEVIAIHHMNGLKTTVDCVKAVSHPLALQQTIGGLEGLTEIPIRVQGGEMTQAIYCHEDGGLMFLVKVLPA